MVDFRYPNLIRRAKVHIIMWKTKYSCIDSSTFMLFYRLIVSIVIYRWRISHAASPKGKEEASPPAPLRMERGVNNTISKQRGHFLDVRRASLRCDETPSSKRRRRLFVFCPAIPANEGQPRYTETIIHGHFSKPLFQTELIIILNYELWFLNYSKSLPLSEEPAQSRDRRPRLETPPSLPQGEECLTEVSLDDSFYPNGCYKVGTDALIWKPLPASPKGRSA